MASAHGAAAAAKVKEAPACLTCHRTRLVSAADGAPAATAKQAQEKLCLSCHLDSPDVRARVAPSAGFIAQYEKSVHGRALLAGNEKAANCVDCHGAHTVRKQIGPRRRVDPARHREDLRDGATAGSTRSSRRAPTGRRWRRASARRRPARPATASTAS